MNQSNQPSGDHVRVSRDRCRANGVIALLTLAMLSCATAAMPRPDDCEVDPDQWPIMFDRSRSNSFCLRVMDLMEAGKCEADAWDTAVAECRTSQGEVCLVYDIVILYCDESGHMHSIAQLVTEQCMIQTVGDGCIHLVEPFAPTELEPNPHPVYTCPEEHPTWIPMWDTRINPECLNLPGSVQHAWVYPMRKDPRWGPCTGELDCACLVGFADCTSLVIECRDPTKPQFRNDRCPNGSTSPGNSG